MNEIKKEYDDDISINDMVKILDIQGYEFDDLHVDNIAMACVVCMINDALCIGDVKKTLGRIRDMIDNLPLDIYTLREIKNI